MGKLLILLGVILAVGGFVASTASFGDTISGAVNTANEAANADQNAADLCEPGETLDKETGASEYTPGQGYGRNVRYFCVDGQGTRREVTGEFATGLLDETDDLLDGLPLMLGGGLAMSAGVILAVIGVIMLAARRSGRTARLGRGSVGQVVTLTPGQDPVIVVNGQRTNAIPPGLENLVQQMQSLKASASASGEESGLEARLLKLQGLRDGNLISQEEYERLRKQILGL